MPNLILRGNSDFQNYTKNDENQEKTHFSTLLCGDLVRDLQNYMFFIKNIL